MNLSVIILMFIVITLKINLRVMNRFFECYTSRPIKMNADSESASNSNHLKKWALTGKSEVCIERGSDGAKKHEVQIRPSNRSQKLCVFKW